MRQEGLKARSGRKRQVRTTYSDHSDRGIQYACAEYRRELQRHGLVASISRRSIVTTMRPSKRFGARLKRKALEESESWSGDRVRRELFEFIESDYNRSRLHSSLGYQPRVDFEQQKN